MKRVLFVALILIFNLKLNAQSSQTNTTQEITENVNTLNNTTKIKLIDLDFNGEKIPINLTYDHTGVKVNNRTNNLGTSWKIENIGFINRIINDVSDTNTIGWFNTPLPSLTPFEVYASCDGECPQNNGTHTENDLSPDFFSCSTVNGLNFEFLYKKNSSGLPIPVFLNNQDGVIINTNFNQMDGPETNPNIAFNIIDKEGTKYDFINGPILYEEYRSKRNLTRNDYYLKTISNANNTSAINIEYEPYLLVDKVYYQVGYKDGSYPGSDYDNNIVALGNTTFDNYDVDYSKMNIKKITTDNLIINFNYSTLDVDGLWHYIDEIDVRDRSGNYITGFKFEYNSQADGTLSSVSKYNKDKSESMVLYQFEYYDEQGYWFNNSGIAEDHFGYYNGSYSPIFNGYLYNTLPYQLRTSPSQVYQAASRTPDLELARWSSLFKIKNMYGGSIEFEYQLNSENHQQFGYMYGGGLLISSKKTIPNIGKTKITTYQYEELSGFVVLTNNINFHYINYYGNDKMYLQKPMLVDLNDASIIANCHKLGNYYKGVREIEYDYDDYLYTGNLTSFIYREYTANCEGLYRRPILTLERYSDLLGAVKEIHYSYSFSNIETVDRAIFTFERRTSSGAKYVKRKTFEPIKINRIKLIQKKEVYPNRDYMEKIENYTFTNDNNKFLRKISKSNSQGGLEEDYFYYPFDNETIGEPFRNDLLVKNIVGQPLKTEKFIDGEKLFEKKNVYGNDVSTNGLLLSKSLLSKKGNEPTSVLEKSITNDLFDEKGNIVQYTFEKGITVTQIWGYNKSKLIAEIKNVAFSSISSLVTNIQTVSNTGTESDLITALNNLRNNSALANGSMTAYIYKPLIGLSAVIDPKGDEVKYIYDSYNRLQFVKDKNGNIISETNYNYKPY